MMRLTPMIRSSRARDRAGPHGVETAIVKTRDKTTPAYSSARQVAPSTQLSSVVSDYRIRTTVLVPPGLIRSHPGVVSSTSANRSHSMSPVQDSQATQRGPAPAAATTRTTYTDQTSRGNHPSIYLDLVRRIQLLSRLFSSHCSAPAILTPWSANLHLLRKSPNHRTPPAELSP